MGNMVGMWSLLCDFQERSMVSRCLTISSS